jgi:hypothetical protein
MCEIDDHGKSETGLDVLGRADLLAQGLPEDTALAALSRSDHVGLDGAPSVLTSDLDAILMDLAREEHS